MSYEFTYGGEQLSDEPRHIRAEQERIRWQIIDTVVSKVQTFFLAADTIHSAHGNMMHVEDCIDKLNWELLELSNRCLDLLAKNREVSLHKEHARGLLRNHVSVLELLELPHLMDTCVRNGNYDEALGLQALVFQMATNLGNIPVVKLLLHECAAVTEFAQDLLLQRLSGAMQLPECIKVVGYLRGLGVTEPELRRNFIACRGRWVQQSIDELHVHESNTYLYLHKLADIFRIHVFDVVVQYKAVFSDDLPASASWKPSPVAEWAARAVELFLAKLSEVIPQVVDEVELAALLEHYMSCGMSLGRIGLDLRPLFPRLFVLTEASSGSA